jgi:hypothetical protein
MFKAGFGRSHGWRRPKCRLRRSVRPVGRDEGTREAGGLPGGRLLVLFAKESGLSKVTRQAAQRRRNPFEGRALASFRLKAKPSACPPDRRAKEVSPPHPDPLPQGERGSDRKMPRLRQATNKNRSPRAAVFLLAQPVGTRHQQDNRP